MAKVKRDQVALMRTAANVALLAKLAPLFVYEATLRWSSQPRFLILHCIFE
jgi:hypothetical protein